MRDNSRTCNGVELTPMRVDDEEGGEDGVGHWGGPNEGHDECGNLRR